MNLTLIPMVLQILQYGLPVAKELVEAAISEYNLWKSGSVPTASQQSALDAQLVAGDAQLQAHKKALAAA